MNLKPWHKRLANILAITATISLGVFIIIDSFNENVIFFYSPSDLIEKHVQPSNKTMRVGGLVVSGSIKKTPDYHTTFRITDGNNELTIHYTGLLPALFKEGQGTVATGYLTDKSHFEAKELLAKHDENYMPKEVMDSLKKQGHWKESEEK